MEILKSISLNKFKSGYLRGTPLLTSTFKKISEKTNCRNGNNQSDNQTYP